MLPRTGAKLGPFYLTAAARRSPSCVQTIAASTPIYSLNACTRKLPFTASHYATKASTEVATLVHAIKQSNIQQARKSYELIARGNEALDRDTIRNLLSIARKGTRESDLAFVRNVVQTMKQRFALSPHLVEYHALIYAYGVHERPDLAYNVLDLMEQTGVKPRTATYETLLGCYKRAGDAHGALVLYEEMKIKGIRRSLSTYNTLISLVGETNDEEAYELYDAMRSENIVPDAYTYTSLLGIATKQKNTSMGDHVCKEIMERDPTVMDLFAVNSMLSYTIRGANDLQRALDMYYELPNRFPHLKADVVTYNILLDGCLKGNNPARAFLIFGDMQKAGCAPDVITYGTMIATQVKEGNVQGGLDLFDEMTLRARIKPNEQVLNSIAALAPSTGSDSAALDRILTVVDKYKKNIPLDTLGYNALLNGLAKQGRSVQAQNLYDQVFRYNSKKADIATFTSLMLAYINDNLVDDAMDIYYELREHTHASDAGKARFNLDTTFYTTLITAMTHLKGQAMKEGAMTGFVYTVDDEPLANIDGRSQPMLLTALALFNDMRRAMVRPDANVYTAMLHACAQHKDAYVLEQIHKLIRMDLYFDPDTAVYNALMDAYNRVGDGHTVLQIWETLSLSSAPETAIDQTTVSILLDSCGHNGYSAQAREIWRKLKRSGFELNTNNYSSYVECLCRSKSRRGWEEARRIVSEEMRPRYSTNALVDPRPLVDEKTVNTLLSFAKKEGFSEDELVEIEQWKEELLRAP
ncbi:hypothetical protein BX666DRAFT_1952247 [Dichotomocladium elegans]|nr:hypothetical protein BX666DRAFT_1952247 [Dichotomocladium elegans]